MSGIDGTLIRDLHGVGISEDTDHVFVEVSVNAETETRFIILDRNMAAHLAAALIASSTAATPEVDGHPQNVVPVDVAAFTTSLASGEDGSSAAILTAELSEGGNIHLLPSREALSRLAELIPQVLSLVDQHQRKN